MLAVNTVFKDYRNDPQRFKRYGNEFERGSAVYHSCFLKATRFNVPSRVDQALKVFVRCRGINKALML